MNVDRLLEGHKFSPDGSIFDPESLQDIRERLTYIAANECVCSASPHLNALHDLAYDDVPALLRAVEHLATRLAALEQVVVQVREITGHGLRSGNSAAEDALLSRNVLVRIVATLNGTEAP